MKRIAACVLAAALAACASATPDAGLPIDSCKAEVDRLNALLAAESAERQKLVRAASRREDTLRRQLDAMKSIERGILDRDDGKPTETR